MDNCRITFTQKAVGELSLNLVSYVFPEPVDLNNCTEESLPIIIALSLLKAR